MVLTAAHRYGMKIVVVPSEDQWPSGPRIGKKERVRLVFSFSASCVACLALVNRNCSIQLKELLDLPRAIMVT